MPEGFPVHTPLADWLFPANPIHRRSHAPIQTTIATPAQKQVNQPPVHPNLGLYRHNHQSTTFNHRRSPPSLSTQVNQSLESSLITDRDVWWDRVIIIPDNSRMGVWDLGDEKQVLDLLIQVKLAPDLFSAFPEVWIRECSWDFFFDRECSRNFAQCKNLCGKM